MCANNALNDSDLESDTAAYEDDFQSNESDDSENDPYVDFGCETFERFNNDFGIGESEGHGQDEADCGCRSTTSTLGNTRQRGVDDTTIAQLSSTNPPNKTDMRYEGNRLDSFDTWPRDAHADPQLLARDGFKYSGQSDLVICVFCLGRLRSWEEGDYPDSEHSKHYPNCRFVLGEHVGNVPIATDPRRIYTNQSNVDREPSRKNVTLLQSTAKSQQLSAKVPIKTNTTTVNNPFPAAPVPRLTGISNFPVEEREIKARMDTQKVRTVLEMGYSENLVQNVLRQRLKSTGNDFNNLVSFIEALNAAQRKSAKKSRQQNVVQSSKIEHHKKEAKMKSVGSQTVTLNEQQNQENPANKVIKNTENRAVDASKSNVGNKIDKTATTATTAAAAYVSDKCHKCHTNEINTAFLPCGHALLCVNCAQKLQNCTLCGQNIQELFRIYLS